MSASDVAAWVAVVLAFIGAWVAWLQLRTQLHDIARQTRSLERQQANDVVLDFDPPFDGSPPPDSRPWYAAVINNSNRPIRDVFCGIPAVPGGTPVPADHWVILKEWPIVARNHFSYLLPAYPLGKRSEVGRHLDPGEPEPEGGGSELDIIRGGEKIGFTFNHSNWNPGTVVQFTDDADLRWQIDGDLHLQEIRSVNRRMPHLAASRLGLSSGRKG